MPTERPDFLPAHNSEYLQAAYWEKRFQQEDEYEWCKGFAEFQHLVLPHLAKTDRILIIGCGNSLMPMDLWRAGYRNVKSLDLSHAVISKMASRAASMGMDSLTWLVGDMLDLQAFQAGYFDAVIEKGTMDVLFVDNDSPWDPSTRVQDRVSRVLDEIHRVLKGDGVFLSITFAQPHFRRPFLLAQHFTWSMEVGTFGEGFHYFVYALRKGARRASDKPEHFVQGQHGGAETEAASKCQIEKSMMHEHMDDADYLLRVDV